VPKCPTCGSEVEVVSTGEGTCYYQPARFGPCETCRCFARQVPTILGPEFWFCARWRHEFCWKTPSEARGCGWYEPRGEETKP
jgi:hypothetical protein